MSVITMQWTRRDGLYLLFAVICCHVISFHVCRPLHSTFLHMPGMSIKLLGAYCTYVFPVW